MNKHYRLTPTQKDDFFREIGAEFFCNNCRGSSAYTFKDTRLHRNEDGSLEINNLIVCLNLIGTHYIEIKPKLKVYKNTGGYYVKASGYGTLFVNSIVRSEQYDRELIL